MTVGAVDLRLLVWCSDVSGVVICGLVVVMPCVSIEHRIEPHPNPSQPTLPTLTVSEKTQPCTEMGRKRKDPPPAV